MQKRTFSFEVPSPIVLVFDVSLLYLTVAKLSDGSKSVFVTTIFFNLKRKHVDVGRCCTVITMELKMNDNDEQFKWVTSSNKSF